MPRHLRVVSSGAPLPDSDPGIQLSRPGGSVRLGVSQRPPYRTLFSSTGGNVDTTCSGGRCPQPITIDREFAHLGRCYAHAKVQAGLIQDYYEGPTFDDDGHKLVDGELVPMVLP